MLDIRETFRSKNKDDNWRNLVTAHDLSKSGRRYVILPVERGSDGTCAFRADSDYAIECVLEHMAEKGVRRSVPVLVRGYEVCARLYPKRGLVETDLYGA